MDTIKQRRESLGLTQYELSVKAKVCRKTLSVYECGKGSPTTKTLAKLAKALNCEIKDLL